MQPGAPSNDALNDTPCCGDVTQQASLLSARQAYLDEFERRNPAGFQQWLAAGARHDDFTVYLCANYYGATDEPPRAG